MNSKFQALPDDIQALLDTERNNPDPAIEAQGRVAGMLSATLGIPLLVPGALGALDAAASAANASNLDPSLLDPSLIDPSLFAGGAKAAAASSAAKSSVAAKGLAAAGTMKGPAVAGTAAAATSGAAVGGGVLAVLAKPIVAGLFVMGALVAGGTAYQQMKAPEKGPVHEAVSAFRAEAEGPLLGGSADALVQELPKIKKHGKSNVVVKKRSPGQQLKAEQKLLWQAKRELHAGDAKNALHTLNKHARRFSKGQLSEERDALEVMALARSGAKQKALKTAAAFKKRYPKSLFLSTVEQATQ